MKSMRKKRALVGTGASICVDEHAARLPQVTHVGLAGGRVQAERLLQSLRESELDALTHRRRTTDVEVGALLKKVDDLVRLPEDNVANVLLFALDSPGVSVVNLNATFCRFSKLRRREDG